MSAVLQSKPSDDFRVADLSLADWGRKEIAIAETEMPGLMAIRDEFAALVKEVAMQIAAASPAYATREEVPADLLEKEKAIYRAQTENSGKPANVLEKIIEGKLGSYYKQTVLTDQDSIRDTTGKTSVKAVLAAANKTLGCEVSVTRFARLKVGEAAQ